MSFFGTLSPHWPGDPRSCRGSPVHVSGRVRACGCTPSASPATGLSARVGLFRRLRGLGGQYADRIRQRLRLRERGEWPLGGPHDDPPTDAAGVAGCGARSRARCSPPRRDRPFRRVEPGTAMRQKGGQGFLEASADIAIEAPSTSVRCDHRHALHRAPREIARWSPLDGRPSRRGHQAASHWRTGATGRR